MKRSFILIAVVFLVAIGLSMDNLAVILSAGCTRSRHSCMRFVVQVSLLFAFAQNAENFYVINVNNFIQIYIQFIIKSI